MKEYEEKNIIISSAERIYFILMNMRQIETFLETTRHRSFSEAANALFISTPALNQQIKILEESIGFTLFERSPRGIHLTKAGESFRETASILISVYNDGVAKGKQIANIRDQEIRIAIPLEDTPPYLVDLSSKFCAANAPLELSFLPFLATEEINACITGKVDLYFAHDHNIIENGLLFIPLYEDDMYIVMSSQDPISRKESLILDDLNGKTLYVEEQYENGPDSFDHRVKEAGIHVNFDRSIYSTSTLINISLGNGVLPIPYRWLTNYGPLLKAIPLHGFSRTYGFICRKEHSKNVDLFADFARNYFDTSSSAK